MHLSISEEKKIQGRAVPAWRGLNPRSRILIGFMSLVGTDLRSFIFEKPKVQLVLKLLIITMANILFISTSFAAETSIDRVAKDVGNQTSQIGLISTVSESLAYDQAIKKIKQNATTLMKSQKALSTKIGKYKWAKHLRSYGKSKSSIKAFETLTKKINQFEITKLKKSKSLSKLTKLIKFPKTKTSVFKAGGDLKLGKLSNGIGKAGKVAGVAGTVVSIGMDVIKMKERIKKGSTPTLEGLNIALKAVEFFQPTLPIGNTPSDVARAIIDLQSALKQKNKSILNSTDMLRKNTSEVTTGGASIEAYIARKMVDGSLDEELLKKGGSAEVYNNIRKEYEKHISYLIDHTQKLKSSLEIEQISVSNKNEDSFYTSAIIGVNRSLKKLYHKDGSIRMRNDGLDLVKSFGQVARAKRDISKSRKNLMRADLDFSKKFIEVANHNLDSFKAIQQQAIKNNERLNIEKAKATKQKILALHTKKKINALKVKVESLRQQNLKLASALEKDPNNSKLKQQLNENAQAYLDIRSSIRKTEPDFGLPIDTAKTVSKRLQNNTHKMTRREEKRLAVKAKIKRINQNKRNAERKRLIGELSQKFLNEQKADRKQRDAFESNRSNAVASKNSKIQRLRNKRNAKQRKLDKLNAAAGRTETSTQTVSSSSSQKVWVAGNAAKRDKLKKLVAKLRMIKNYEDNSHEAYWKLGLKTKKALQKVADLLGVKNPKFVYNHISRFYNSRVSDLANMPETAGHYEPVSTPSTYTKQVTRLGLSSAESKRQKLILDINNIDGSLTNTYNSLNRLNRQRYTSSTSVQADQQRLGNLVRDYLSATKTQIGITQGNSVNFTRYKGVISMTSNALLITGDFDGTNTKLPPSVGMKMLPSNHDGVFSGNYSIASKTSRDSSGVYNYLSWGTWQASSTSTHTLLDGSVFPTDFGGQWLMGKVAFHIPKQGSATYIGNISGDYVSPSGIRSPGVMNGSIRFTSNFSTGGLTGSAHIYKNGSSWATPTFSHGSTIIEQSQGGSAHIQAGLTGGLGGGISGGFFGKNGATPAESGGAWWFDHNDSSSATGIYRAKKQ